MDFWWMDVLSNSLYSYVHSEFFLEYERLLDTSYSTLTASRWNLDGCWWTYFLYRLHFECVRDNSSKVRAIISNIVAFNDSISTKTNFSIFSCASQRLILDIKDVLSDDDIFLEKLNRLMVKVRVILLVRCWNILHHCNLKFVAQQSGVRSSTLWYGTISFHCLFRSGLSINRRNCSFYLPSTGSRCYLRYFGMMYLKNSRKMERQLATYERFLMLSWTSSHQLRIGRILNAQ